ncbi:MAG TPA: DUF1476 domain-containing protein [Stellaceae bacterium]|jgi:hypothetical protein|nr:DUF1476 domain-containing protein [Stellaceae bacterium]
MTTFDEREKEFEARFKHDEEFRFKVAARRNRLFGLWAAERLGLAGGAAEAYAREVINAQFAPGGDQNVVAKVAADLGPRDPAMTPERIRFELEHFAGQAKQQLMRE